MAFKGDWYEIRFGTYFCKRDGVQLVPVYQLTDTFERPIIQCPICKERLKLDRDFD